MRWASVFLLVGIGCGNQGTDTDPPELGTGSAQPAPPSDDMGVPPVASLPQGGPWIPPPSTDPPVTHAPASPLSGATSMLSGVNIVDVSTDKGGGIWAVSD